jgi:hypothetical protein
VYVSFAFKIKHFRMWQIQEQKGLTGTGIKGNFKTHFSTHGLLLVKCHSEQKAQ